MKRARIRSEVNAGSMADIAFLLLIFFLVTTTIASDKGITFLLPPIHNTPPIPLSEDRVLTVMINGNDEISIEGQSASVDQISDRLKLFLQDSLSRDMQPVLSLQLDRLSTYEVFISAYDQIRQAFSQVRDETSRKVFNKTYKSLSVDHQRRINQLVPMIISEAEPVDLFE